MTRELLDHLGIMAQICLLLCTVLWLWRFKSWPNEVKRLGPFILITLAVNAGAFYLSKKAIPNLFLLHIYTLLELLTWAFFYQYLFRNKPRAQQVFPWFIGLLSVLIVLNSLLLEPTTGFNSNAKSLVQLLLMAVALFYFFNAFGKIDLNQPLPRSLTLINFAVIFYYSGSLFIFMFSKLLKADKTTLVQQNSLWAINALIYVIFLIIILFSLWIVAFPKTKSS